MPSNEQEINNIGAKIAYTALMGGINIAEMIFNFPVTPHTKDEILQFLSSKTGLPPSTISLADSSYDTIEWSNWLKFIAHDTTNKIKKYTTDVWDCEDFATWFCIFSCLIMGINTGALAFGNILDPITKKTLFAHGFNLILATENGVLKLYLFEPQTFQWKEWEMGKDNILPVQASQNWLYHPTWIFEV